MYLDTHVVAWLYAGKVGLFPRRAVRELDRQELLVSPMVVLELQYLFELQRVTEPASEVVGDLQRRVGLRICQHPFPEVAQAALDQTWTRDPFDRIIVAQASLESQPLLTKDAKIRDHYAKATWD